MPFPAKGDRVIQPQYGAGTVTEIDTIHTVIDFDLHGPRRFITSRVNLAPTTEPGPSPSEKRAADALRKREARKRKLAAPPEA
jgi:hypothetical protein